MSPRHSNQRPPPGPATVPLARTSPAAFPPPALPRSLLRPSGPSSPPSAPPGLLLARQILAQAGLLDGEPGVVPVALELWVLGAVLAVVGACQMETGGTL